MRVSISRRQSTGRQFAGFLYFRRRPRRTRRGEICRWLAVRRGRNLIRHVRKRKKAPGREKSALISNQGDENPITIWRELGEIMTEHVTVTHINKNLEQADAGIQALQARYL